MNILLNSLPSGFYDVDGVYKPINTSYKTVLKYFTLMKDPMLTVEEKTVQTIVLFFGNDPCIQNYRLAFDFIKDYIRLGEESDGSTETQKEVVLDFNIDSMAIYSAFIQAYSIDLTDSDMHWFKFIALIRHLPEETYLHKVMTIRGRKLPKPNKHNQEEIRELKRLKDKHRIEVDYTVEEKQQKVAAIFEGLRQRAVRNNGKR